MKDQREEEWRIKEGEVKKREEEWRRERRNRG